MAAAHKSLQPLLRFCVLIIFRNICLLVHFHRNVRCCCIFLQNFSTGDPGIFFAYISMTTRARVFKFAGAIVHNNSSKVVVGNGALDSKFFSEHYAWFSRGRSHIHAHA